MKHILPLVSLLMVLALLITACAGLFPAAASTPSAARPIIILASDQPGSADPAENWAFGGAAYLPLVYEGLFQYVGSTAPRLEVQLAAEIPTVENGGISTDGLVYTIRLKPNARFHDGSPVNADAVIYSYERMGALQLGANGVTTDWIARLEKVDELTVRITLTQPFGDFLNSMGSVWGNYIVNPAVVKANEINGDHGHAYLLDHDAGSGPYTITSFDHTPSQITLERVATYWGGWNNPQPIDRAIIRWLAEPTAARAMLEKGDADVLINPQATDFVTLQSAANIKTAHYPGIMQYYLGLNTAVKPLDDVRVRRALAHSLNTEVILHDIFLGNLSRMEAAVGPGYPEVLKAAMQYPYDLEKARALLKEAGYENGLELTANRMNLWSNDAAVLEFWRADLKKIGVTLLIQELDGATWSNIWFNECAAAASPEIGPISAMSVGGDYPSAWEVLAQVFPVPRLGGGRCSAVYRDNPVINDTILKISQTTSSAERAAYFQILYDAIAEDASAIWVGQGQDLIAMRDVVQGYEYSFSKGGNYLPLQKMSLTR